MTAIVRSILAVAIAAAAGAEWPEFRGPAGNGHAVANAGVPLTWSETSNVAWKTATPHRGWSTPAVSGNQVWITAATDDGHEFFALCLDAATGAVLFNERLFQCADPEPLGNEVNGYASPSPVAAPGRAYVHFGRYGTACIDTSTFATVWKRDDLPCRHYRGPGSSPILADGKLILTFDGADQQYVAALDAATGATVWRTDRATAYNDLDENGQPQREGDLRKAYSTPLAIDAAGTAQIVTVGSMSAFAYAPATGETIWSLPLPGYTPATRPVYANGLVYLTTGRRISELLAVRPDGRGDIAATHVAWRAAGALVPLEPSPLCDGGLLYVVNNNGVATCFDAATGETVWSERIGGNYVASPILAGGRLYFCSTQGKTTVLRPGRAFESLAVNELGDGFMASPAVHGNALILRSKSHVYRIENTGGNS